MIYRIFFFLLFISIAHAEVSLRIHFPNPKVKQGSLASASIILDGQALQQFEIQKLRGQTLSDTIYFQSVGPLLKKDNEYSADIKLIIAKAPENHTVTGKIGQTDLSVNLMNIELLPTEAPKTFIFGTFEIPKEFKIFGWIVGLIILGALVVVGYKIRNKLQSKAELKKKKISLKAEILNANTYEDIVVVWKKKFLYQETFPHINDAFKDFETVLFKHSFKPKQSELEKSEVVGAYKEFTSKIEGGFNGI